MRIPIILFAILSLVSASAQNIVPVQANTNGALLSPSPFLRVNITGAGGIFIHPALTGNAIVASNSASGGGGGVSYTDLNTASNAIKTILIGYDAFSSNYLYSLIVGGGTGEVNRNANAGATNGAIFGWVNDKSGTTNYLKTFEPRYGLALTNLGNTNLQVAVDGAIIPNQTQLNNSSNILRIFIVANDNLSSNGLLNVTIANDVITINYLTGIITNRITTTSNFLFSVINTASNALDTLVRTKQHGTANLTNWSSLPTNVLNGWQAGTALLTNFQAMGISNIVAGSNMIVFTNGGRLVIASIPDGVGSGGGGALATNDQQFAATSVLTIKDAPRFTNIYAAGIMSADSAVFDGNVTFGADAYFGNAYFYGVTSDSLIYTDGDQLSQPATIGSGISFSSGVLSAEVTTSILITASNALRSFTISNGSAVSNGVIAYATNSVTVTSNALRSFVISSDIIVSNALNTTITNASTVTSNGLRTVIDSKQNGSTVLTNISNTGAITNAGFTNNYQIGSAILTNLSNTGALTNIASANAAFTSLLRQSNQPIVKTVSAGAGMTLTDNASNVVIAATSPHVTPSIQTSNFVSTTTTADYAKDVYYTNGAFWAWVQAGILLHWGDINDISAMGLYIDQDADGVFEESGNIVSIGGIASSAFSNPQVEQNTILRDILKPGARFIFTNLTTDPGGNQSTADIRAGSSKLFKTGD